MVVDDEPDLRDIFAQWFERLGCHSVRRASDGAEALELLRVETVDLLVTDIRMPRMTGVELVRAIHAESIVVPSILFVSGFGDIDKREMYSLGVEGFLSKPVSRKDVIASAELSIARRERLWEAPQPASREAQLLTVQNCAVGRSEASALEASHANGVPVRFGRGGFCLRAQELMAPGRIGFTLHFPVEDQVLSGNGYVRWFSRSEMTVGIEFSYLAEPGRSWLLANGLPDPCNGFIPLLAVLPADI